MLDTLVRRTITEERRNSSVLQELTEDEQLRSKRTQYLIAYGKPPD